MPTPIPLSLHLDIVVTPALNREGYAAFISAWVDPEIKNHHHAPGNVPLDMLADWVAANVRSQILARRVDMQKGKAEWLAATASLPA